MHAILANAERLNGIESAETDVPRPGAHEALVEVHAFSPNPGEINHVIPAAARGAVVGWQAAGVVRVAAADGAGPPVGTRVLGFSLGLGAWADQWAVSVDQLGTAPEDADPGVLSATPIQATSALRALDRAGSVLGKRVLVSGGTGAVGRVAVQLAVRAGAYVLATCRRSEQRSLLDDLGADEVIVTDGEFDIEPVDLVIDSVGGRQLVRGFDSLTEDGRLISVGRASGEPASFPADSLMADADRPRRELLTYFMPDAGRNLPRDLTWLAREVAAGRLRIDLAWTGGWSDAEEAVQHVAAGSDGSVVVRTDR